MKYFLTTVFLLIFIVFHTTAQDRTVSGIVKDATALSPLSNAQVINQSSGSGVTTDNNGHFSISVDLSSDVSLVVSYLGYETTTLVLKPGKTYNNISVMLRPKSEQLQEVEIMGATNTAKSYRTENVDINTLEQSNLQDVGDLLRGVPNVSGVRKGAMGIDPVIRGFKYSQLNVQLNGGTRIEGGCPNRMDPATAHVDVTDLKNITILKGPFALKYGVNFAGVIDLTTYNPEFFEKYKTNVDVLLGGQTNHSGFKTKVGVSGANKIFTYSFSGSWKKYGDYTDGNNEWVKASLVQQTYTGAIGFRIAKKHMIYATADISQGANIDFPTLPMDERKDDTKLFSLNYYANDIGKSINFIRFKAYLSDVNHEMDNKNRPFSDTVVAVSNIHAVNTGGKFGVNFNVGGAKMEVGGDYENIRKDGTRMKNLIMQPNLPKKEEDLWNDATINNLGVFAEYHRPGKKIDWIVAARVDHNTANSGPLLRTNMAGDAVYQNDTTDSQYTNFSINGGLTWHISNRSDLVFSIGRGTRSPDMAERFIILLPIGYDPYDYLGNPQLNPEINNEVDLGYRFNHEKGGSLEVSGFFSYINNYITGVIVSPSEIKPQTKGVLGVKRFENVDQAYISGFELTYQTAAKYLWQINFNAAYTMGWNPEVNQTIFVDGVAREQTIKNDPLPEIPPFEINLGFNYKFFKSKFVPSISIRMAAAQNKVSEAYNEQTTPGFTMLSLDLKYQFNSYFSVYAGVKNLFDQAYYEHLNRNIIGTSYPLYEPGRVFYANLIFKF